MLRHLSLPLLLLVVSLCLGASLPAQEYGDLPLSFEPNRGQADPGIEFLSHGKGYAFLLSRDCAVLRLGAKEDGNIKLAVADGRRPSKVEGENLLPGVVNYLSGHPGQSLRNLPTYSRVRMRNVYPDVDLVYYGNHRQLEYDFVVHPGGQANAVGLLASGAQLKLMEDGGLTMQAGSASVHWHAPVAYQLENGRRRPVPVKYQVAGMRIGFALGEYDHARDLVIDPVLSYSTYVGGNGGDVGDAGNAIAVDANGNAYLAGMAASSNFPTTANAMQPATHGNDDAFVAKLNPQGTAYVYSTYIGGGGQDVAWGIAVDAAGEVFVAGQTGSGLNGTSAFPTTAGAYQRTPNPNSLNNSVFVAKLSADGSNLLYSTYLSGGADSFASGIAIDGGGNAYVLTNTAGGFPTTSAAYQKSAGTFACPYQQFADGDAQVVTKVNPTGTALVYSTYVGHGCDYGSGIAVNAAGEAYITGYTQDSAYPHTTGAAQSNFGGVVDAFITRLNASGSGLIYSTFLGGSLADFGAAIALDSSGYAYVAGGTDGSFPTTAGAFETTATNNGYRKGFVAKISPMGKALVYSTYVRGAANVSFNGIAVDSAHNAYMTGYSDGKQYPATNTADQGTCYSTANGCLTQAVVTKINATGNALLYSSYFGASDGQNSYFPGNIGNAIAVDRSGGFYITGRTSGGLKTTASAAEPSYRSTSTSSDAFVAKFNPYGSTTTNTTVKIASPLSGAIVGSPVTVSASASGGSVGWMQLYVDGVRKDQVSGSVLKTKVNLGAGSQRITVQAVNKDGSIAKSTVYVTVK